MSEWLMTGVVALQVVVFQFVSIRLTRSLPSFLVGVTDLPAGTGPQTKRFRAEAGRRRLVAGGILLVALAGAAATGPGEGAGKVIVAAVSVLSSLLFLAGYVRDRAAVASMARAVPTGSVRSASLSRPGLRDHYAPAWEAAVMAVWVMAAVPVVRGIAVGASGATALLGLALCQALVALGGLAFSVWYAANGSRLPQRARGRIPGGDGVGVDHALRRAELRTLLHARIGILVLLGLKAVSVSAPGGEASGAVEMASWMVVAALLGVFAAYLARTARIADQATTSDGGPGGSIA